MEQSLLFKLPAELRVRLYECLFVSKARIDIKPHCTTSRKPIYLNISKTCKAIRDECLPIFYAKNKFRISCPFHFAWFGGESSSYTIILQRCAEWLESIGRRNARCITFLLIHGGMMDMGDELIATPMDLTTARLLECSILGQTGLKYESLYNDLFFSISDCRECPTCDDFFSGEAKVELQVCAGFDSARTEDIFEELEDELDSHAEHDIGECGIAQHFAACYRHLKTARAVTELLAVSYEDGPLASKVKSLWDLAAASRAASEEL